MDINQRVHHPQVLVHRTDKGKQTMVLLRTPEMTISIPRAEAENLINVIADRLEEYDAKATLHSVRETNNEHQVREVQ